MWRSATAAASWWESRTSCRSRRRRRSAHVGTISTFVALAFHGQGIGSRLTQATLQTASQRGFLKISATIRADNPRAVAFYLRQGFRVIGTAHRHAFVGGRYIDEILAERWLD
jgi:RimJ/RimL family protein N-acetyltransferase